MPSPPPKARITSESTIPRPIRCSKTLILTFWRRRRCSHIEAFLLTYASYTTRCTIPTLESTATSVCVCGSQCCRVQSEAEQLQYAGLRDLLVVGLPCRVCNLSLTPAPPRQTRRTYIYYFTTTAEYHSEIEKLRNLHVNLIRSLKRYRI